MLRLTPSVDLPQRRQLEGRHLLIEDGMEVAVHHYVDMPGGYWAYHHAQLCPDPGNPLHVGALPPLVQVGQQRVPAPPTLRLRLEPDIEL